MCSDAYPARGNPPAPEILMLIDRVSERLGESGAPHPVVGATALAVRGLTGSDVGAFATELGMATYRIEAIEAGEVSAANVDAELRRAASRLGLTFLQG